MTFDNLLLEHHDRVVTITINRPNVLNALNTRTMDELRHAVLALGRDEAVRAIILTGAGEKAFVAGADIAELSALDPASGRAHALEGQHVLDVFEHLGKPIIAAINGYALGGGCELAMACTLRIAAATARLGQPEVRLGIIPGYAGTQRLGRLVGKARAMEIILSGRHVTAEEALRIGLVHRVVAPDALAAEARRWADELATQAPVAMRCAIEAVNRGLDMPFAHGSALEATLFGLVASTEDMREGTRAFLEKRAPSFKGR